MSLYHAIDAGDPELQFHPPPQFRLAQLALQLTAAGCIILALATCALLGVIYAMPEGGAQNNSFAWATLLISGPVLLTALVIETMGHLGLGVAYLVCHHGIATGHRRVLRTSIVLLTLQAIATFLVAAACLFVLIRFVPHSGSNVFIGIIIVIAVVASALGVTLTAYLSRRAYKCR